MIATRRARIGPSDSHHGRTVRPFRRRLSSGLVAVALLGVGASANLALPETGRPPTTPLPGAATDSLLAFGAYQGGLDLGAVRAYEKAIGIPDDQHLSWVMRYATGTRRGGWDEWRSSITALLDVFADEDQPRKFILSTPMLVTEPIPSGDTALRAAGFAWDPRNLAAGAAGAYDDHWRWLGEQLVAAYGNRLEQDFVLRPGWEQNGSWYQWGIGTSGSEPGDFDRERAANYAAYWRRAHRMVMEPVEEAGLDLLWSYSGSGGKYRTGGFEAAYPGDDFVDIASIDLYQNYDFRSTIDFGAADEALTWLTRFAGPRRKLLAIDETSVSYRVRDGEQVGGEDNALWFSSIREWSDDMVDDRRLHHVVAFEADPAEDDLFGPVFPTHPGVYRWPQARADLIESFGGPRPD